MERIGENLTDLSWWFTVLVAGVLVNLLAAAIIKYGPKLLGKFSDRWAERNEKARRERRESIKRLMESEERRAELRWEAQDSQNTVNMLLVSACLFFLIYQLFESSSIPWPLSAVFSLSLLVAVVVAMIAVLIMSGIGSGERRLLREVAERMQQEDEPADETENDD